MTEAVFLPTYKIPREALSRGNTQSDLTKIVCDIAATCIQEIDQHWERQKYLTTHGKEHVCIQPSASLLKLI